MKGYRYKLPLLMAICLSFLSVGCGYEKEKQCCIEIQDSDGMDIAILEELTQKDIEAFIGTDSWIECESLEDILSPEYTITLYQEKTHTIIQMEEDTYECLLEYTTYKNSDIVRVVIGENAVKSKVVPEEYLAFYYVGSEEFFAFLHDMTE